MNKIWEIKNANKSIEQKITDAFNVNPIISRLLVNREIIDLDQAKQFLFPSFDKLHNPYLFKDFGKAIERIQKAKTNGEKVLIYGDYDVDGVTSSALLTNALRDLGLDVINHIPHRMHDGYGLNEGIVKFAKNEKVALLITVD